MLQTLDYMGNKKRNLRQRNVSESEEEEDEPTSSSKVLKQDEDDAELALKEVEEEEIKREEDIKERDAFVKRLLDRDSEATKKVAPGQATRADQLKRLEDGELVTSHDA